MKLSIASDDRDHAILVCDEDHNDIAEFYHSDHATVDQSYETALALAKQLVEVATETRQQKNEREMAEGTRCDGSCNDGLPCHCAAPGPRNVGSTPMFKNLWCALFHRRHIRQTWASGDWKRMYCDKCQITWPEPRL